VDQILLIEKLFNLIDELHGMTGVPAEQRLKDKNVQKTAATDSGSRVKAQLSTTEKKRTKEIATLFAQTFIAYQNKNTPDKSGETLIKKMQRQTQTSKTPQKEEKSGKWGVSLFAGLVALIGGAAALIYGLFQGGPLTGIMKIISKIGISGGLKMITRSVKIFVKLFSGLLKAPLQIFSRVGKFFSSVGKSIKGMFSGMMPKFLKNIGKNKGFMSRMINGIGKFLIKGLKKVPLIGNVISIAFAVKNFMDGDVVAGVIDTLSALAGLLYLVPGGQPFGFAISLGLDVLNAWLDVKAEQGKEKGLTKMDILKDMVSKVGAWLKPKVKYIPILRSLFDFGDAFNAFKKGDVTGGFKHIGVGLLSFLGVNSLMDGISFFTSMFSGNGKKEDNQPKQKSVSWIDKIREWVKKKLQSLPMILRKPLEWLGFIDGDGENIGEIISRKSSEYGDKIGQFVNSLWNSITTISDNIYNTFKEKLPMISETIGSVISGIGNFIKNINPFSGGGGGEQLTDAQKAEKAKQAGWGSWEEYEKSGWQYKSSTSSASISTPQSDSNLSQIARTHFTYMQTMISYNKAMYNVLVEISKNGMGGSGRVINNTPIMPSQSSPNPANISSFGDNRGGYVNSDYAFA
jgi:hypothetical protein